MMKRRTEGVARPGLILISLLFMACQHPVIEQWPDLAEFESVHQYLQVFSIYQDRVVADPFMFSEPESLMIAVGDTLKSNSYTGYTGDAAMGAQASITNAQSDNRTVWFDSLTDSTALLSIKGFNGSTLGEFDALLGRFVGFSNIVIDVRDNRGGELDVLDSIMEALLPAETAYILARERAYDELENRGYTKEWHARTTRLAAHPAFARKKMAALIDHNTASAAEILAAGLKDRAGAALVGNSNSYGKAIGQIRLPRHKRPTLQITYLQLKGITARTGEYHRKGLVPDTIPLAIRLAGNNEPDPVLFYGVKLLEESLTRGTLPVVPRHAAKMLVPACYRTLPEDILD